MSLMPRPPESALIAFYTGTGKDNRGRTFDDVLAFSMDDLEFVHDYIQWLFPLFERSGANPAAPILDDRSAAAFRRDPQLRRSVRRAVATMLAFYGLQLSQGPGVIVIRPASSFAERSANWLTPRNHNFLRLTRILKCLSILHAGTLARALLACLLDIDVAHPGVISDRTIEYWKNAVPP